MRVTIKAQVPKLQKHSLLTLLSVIAKIEMKKVVVEIIFDNKNNRIEYILFLCG